MGNTWIAHEDDPEFEKIKPMNPQQFKGANQVNRAAGKYVHNKDIAPMTVEEYKRQNGENKNPRIPLRGRPS